MTIIIGWWAIPTVVTLLGLFWALVIIDDDGGGFLNGISNLLALVPVSIISAIFWVVFVIWVR